MKDRVRSLAFSSACVLGLTLAACGGETASPPVEASQDVQCIELAEGTYVFENGQFIATSLPPQKQAERIASRPVTVAWASDLETDFADSGFAWMGLSVRGDVAVLTGIAPGVREKERAFAAGQSAIEEHADAGETISLVVDGISVAGGEHGVGEALAALIDTGITQATCQKAFDETMDGRRIIFQSNLAIVSPVSTRLLEAATGIAHVCADYDITIESHTDSRGSDEYNRIISQQRADAVKAFMVKKGVPEDILTSLGYGETDPIDPAENEEAWARNRRTVFKVSSGS